MEHKGNGMVETSPDRETRRAEKAMRRLTVQEGPLEPEARYKALMGMLRIEQEFLELADRKARFALLIMGALNAAALVVVFRGGEAGVPTGGLWGVTLAVELVAYVAVTMYYIGQAIDTLRPRGKQGRPQGELPTVVTPGGSMRVLFHEDIARRDRDEHRRLWHELRMDNLTAELADQLHLVSRINVEKFASLTRLYRGLGVLTVMVTVTLGTIVAYRVLA